MYLIDLDPERRRRYRIALYTGLAVLVALLAGGTWVLDRFFRPPPQEIWTVEELAAHPDVQLLQSYVRIDTSRETGSELAGAEFLAAELESAGISAVIEPLGERQANLWAILEGDDPQAIVLHNHIDVYPVEDPDGWTHPPFGAEIDDVWLFGRGVFDMKSVTIAQLRAIQSLAARNERPRRSVIFLATSGEETGSDLGTRWVLDRHPELAARFWAVLTEGGVVEPKSQTEIKYWGVEFAQKRFATLWACADDRARLERLRQDILEWRAGEERWRLTDEAAAFFAAYGGSRDSPKIRKWLGDPLATLVHYPRFRLLPDYLKATLRDEVVPLGVEEDPDGGHRLKILLHLLPGTDAAAMRERLLPDWMLHGVALSAEPPLGADHGSPLDHEALTTTAAAIGDAYPDTTVGPYFLPWSATDSRFFRDAGIPSYGFSPFLIFNTDTFRVDAVDERIGLPGFLSGVELYTEVLRRLAG